MARGRGAGVAVATGMETEFGGISVEVSRLGEVRTPLQVRLDQFGGIIAVAVLGVTVLVVVLGLLAGEQLGAILLTAEGPQALRWAGRPG